jgi:hypothetical protein
VQCTEQLLTHFEIEKLGEHGSPKLQTKTTKLLDETTKDDTFVHTSLKTKLRLQSALNSAKIADSEHSDIIP